MAIVCTLQTQTVNYDREVFSASATYHVYDDAGAQISANDITTSGTVATILGSTNGSALYGFGAYLAGTGTGTSAYAKLRYTGYSLKNDEGQFHWTMTVNFDSAASDSAPSAAAKDTIPENVPGFTAVEMNLESVVVPTYRTGSYTQPASHALRDSPSDIDIGGTPVDQGGEPIDAFVSVARFTIRWVIRGRPTSGILTAISNQTNTRNDAAITIGGFSCAIGTLLFTGAQVSRVGPNAYEVTYNLAYDDDYHLRQLAVVDPNGRPVVGVKNGASISVDAATVAGADASSNASTGHDAPRYAKTVMWKQPFSTRTSFGNFLPNDLITSIA